MLPLSTATAAGRCVACCVGDAEEEDTGSSDETGVGAVEHFAALLLLLLCRESLNRLS